MIPLSDLPAVLAVAGGAAIAVAVVGALALVAVRRRSIVVGLTVLVLTVVGAGAAATSAAGLAMFISGHDLHVLLVVVVIAAAVGAAGAIVLSRRLIAGVRAVAALARSLADEGPVDRPATPLPSELTALADDLVTAAERLRAARQRERALEGSRRELVGWVSHDLRTPLAGLRAMVEALEDGVVAEPAEVADYHRRMRIETDRLTGMVDDLFELSRLHAGTVRLPTVRAELAELVDDALAAACPVARAAGVFLDARVAGHGVRPLQAVTLSRVLANLVSNAVRHTPAGGAVVVRARATDDGVEVVVDDECGGIPETDLPRVFDVGFRGTAARTPGDGGGGLGLSIAKGLVEAEGGRLSVVNRAGGCRFTVRLPTPARQSAELQLTSD